MHVLSPCWTLGTLNWGACPLLASSASRGSADKQCPGLPQDWRFHWFFLSLELRCAPQDSGEQALAGSGDRRLSSGCCPRKRRLASKQLRPMQVSGTTENKRQGPLGALPHCGDGFFFFFLFFLKDKMFRAITVSGSSSLCGLQAGREGTHCFDQ